MYEAPALCEKCGGKCCKRMSGCMTPEDVMNLFPAQSLTESLRLAFKTDDYVIDWWEGDPRDIDYDDPDYRSKAEYVRPRTDKDHKRLYNAGWSGRCAFLADTGCRLAPGMRPSQCRLLEPKEDDGCTMHDPGSKQAISIIWMPHQAALFYAAKPFA